MNSPGDHSDGRRPLLAGVCARTRVRRGDPWRPFPATSRRAWRNSAASWRSSRTPSTGGTGSWRNSRSASWPTTTSGWRRSWRGWRKPSPSSRRPTLRLDAARRRLADCLACPPGQVRLAELIAQLPGTSAAELARLRSRILQQVQGLRRRHLQTAVLLSRVGPDQPPPDPMPPARASGGDSLRPVRSPPTGAGRGLAGRGTVKPCSAWTSH